jgi:UDP-N-acetylmuramoyl-L-alanyl-D-glutamate--2,6-diaminopimelate ligase
MKLEDILAGAERRTELSPVLGSTQIQELAYDSREIRPNSLFFAFAGKRADGRAFAQEAVEHGAVAVVSALPKPEGFTGTWIEVADGRKALALACRRLFGDLSERISLTGITGTNGKTTVAHLVDSMLRAAGLTTAMVGTIHHSVAGEPRPALNTTPESLDLYRILLELARHGGTHAVMEVSSHALALGRVYGLRFDTAVFTNLTRDHLDFHQNMEGYFAAKQLLFDGLGAPPPRYAVINADDARGREIRIAPESVRLTYGLGDSADVRAANIFASRRGLEFDMLLPGTRLPVRSSLIGKFNVYNILAASCAGWRLGLDWETIARGVEMCGAVAGRFERIDEGQPFTVVVDYAHTDDALRNVILASRALGPARVIVVFGCGGDRDRNKRPLMGAAAGELSDLVVLTSDNPRSEDPLAIMNDAMVGLSRFDVERITEPDREKAIRAALGAAQPGDLVLIAGKGHETYQILRRGTIPFDDREVARRILRDFGHRKEAG